MSPTKNAPARKPAQPDLKLEICGELYIAVERLGAGSDLLAIVGGWRDTLSDPDVLHRLREYNARQPTIRRQR
jgi:hypothetical protein